MFRRMIDDPQYWEALTTWFYAEAMSYFSLLAFAVFAAYMLGVDVLSVKAFAVVSVTTLLLAVMAAIKAWLMVEGDVEGAGGSLRRFSLEMSIRRGESAMMFSIPGFFYWLYLLVRAAWRNLNPPEETT